MGDGLGQPMEQEESESPLRKSRPMVQETWVSVRKRRCIHTAGDAEKCIFALNRRCPNTADTAREQISVLNRRCPYKAGAAIETDLCSKWAMPSDSRQRKTEINVR
eukprot:TRINITY_DN11730_c0_g2_i5.p1 TRINITY_DN11730_c0_g2~~TRINITY_DN11730_c0_g2_i5.p1  ORF type:complete len:106 (-),score=4.73 TRINITY_DN11730_c0_g2_i5:370-687(-)